MGGLSNLMCQVLGEFSRNRGHKVNLKVNLWLVKSSQLKPAGTDTKTDTNGVKNGSRGAVTD